jgi:hypothetical protein
MLQMTASAAASDRSQVLVKLLQHDRPGPKATADIIDA